jgi:hypothetical protein
MSKPDLYIYDDKQAAYYAASGTSLKTKLIGITYDDLVSIFGDPVHQDGDKTNFEWVVDFEGDTFTIYDWKYPDKDYVKNELGHDGGISFHVGGKSYAGDFEDFIEDAKAKGLKFGDNKEDDELPF